MLKLYADTQGGLFKIFYIGADLYKSKHHSIVLYESGYGQWHA